MKILFISDTHLDLNSTSLGYDLLPPFIAYVKRKNPDILIIAGDISDNCKTTINILNILEKELQIPIRFIPGNHDTWVNGDKSSWDSYQKFKNHSTSLIDKPFHINDEYVAIGDSGWYDYSFGPESIAKKKFAEEKKKKWKDGIYSRWKRSDEEMTTYMIDKLRLQLEKNRHKKVIFVNHFIPFYDFITVLQDVDWNFCNAYMGSKQIGELIQTYPNIEWVVFGHTHKKFGKIEDYKGKNFICNPLGYTYEWSHQKFEDELEDTGILLEL